MPSAAECRLDSEECLTVAEEVIRRGGIVVYPTDTLYGLGVDARNDDALERLTVLKGREGPWSIAVAHERMLRRYGVVSEERWEFMKSRLPGEVTFVLKARKSDISSRILGKNNTVGIRIPNHPFPMGLTRKLRFPITSTSVNKTGRPPVNDPSKVEEVFGGEIDLIVDDGTLPPSPGSRIYDLSQDVISLIR